MTTKTTILPHSPAVTRPSNLITIASGKGGVGKTWFAITLSHALARTGKRVLLFDGDLGLANVDIQLGLMPKRDLGNVIGGHNSLGEVITQYREGGFDVIAGKSGSGTLATLARSRLAALKKELQNIARRYDQVILDLGAGLDAGVTVLAENGGTTLVIVTDEPTALTDAYAYIKVATMQNPDTDIRIAVNMAGSRAEGERTYGTLLRACENFLKISPPLAGVVRRDPRVRDAIRHQTAFLNRHPSGEAAEDLEIIAGDLRKGR